MRLVNDHAAHMRGDKCGAHVLTAELVTGQLVCSCEASPHNLVDVLDALRSAGAAIGRVWSEPPTLNDVFLEITGRELRDQE